METIACSVLVASKVAEHRGNDAISTRMGSPSGTSSVLLVAVNATLEKSLFKMGSEVSAHAYEAAETLRIRCENETNEVPFTEFPCLFPKEVEGALPTNSTFVFTNS